MITLKFMLFILHSQSKVYFNMLIIQHFPIKGVLKHKMVVYAGDFNTLLDYEVTFVLDALDQVDIQRIVPNCLHIRHLRKFIYSFWLEK
ncbi:hypothetical protein RGQ29_002430 [Quercus rubra]|uniref:Uncharacterized protein n=1 Tax=Quercus rubra TaxID=3512 RepID=A0AAN7IDQ1_QUERU|nr:hypothetical protein RGQ29_002430 [Quercus rubra]